MSTSNWKSALDEALQFHDPEKTANGGSTYQRMQDWEVNGADISSKLDYDVFSKAKANYHKDFPKRGKTHVTTIGIGSEPLFQWQKFPEDWHVVYESDSDSDYSDSSDLFDDDEDSDEDDGDYDKDDREELPHGMHRDPEFPDDIVYMSPDMCPDNEHMALVQIASAVISEPALKNKKKRKTHPSVATRRSSRSCKVREFYRDEKW